MKAFVSRRTFVMSSGATLMAALMSACGGGQSGDAATPSDAAKQAGIDYMALVNKTHALPEGWEEELAVDMVHVKDSQGWDVAVEKEAYDAYLQLKEALEKEDIHVDLDSAYRSIAEQQKIVEEFFRRAWSSSRMSCCSISVGFSRSHSSKIRSLGFAYFMSVFR